MIPEGRHLTTWLNENNNSMFTDVYIGLVKSEEFDYYKDGNPNGYSPSYAIESLRLKNKPVLFGESDLFCVIRPIPVHFPGAIQSPNEA